MSQDTFEHSVSTPPTAARGGEPCSACGAPLAGDQRYCMYCGTRRAESRLDFLDVLAGERQVATQPPPAAPAEGWLRANTPVLALAAVVLTTLLIGLLVGHWISVSTPPAAQAPAPQVIRISGGGQATTPAPATTTTPSDAGSTTPATAPKKSATKSTGGASDVKKLSKKQLDKAVKKGKPITTGNGKPPPKDDKPAGNGTSFETIG